MTIRLGGFVDWVEDSIEELFRVPRPLLTKIYLSIEDDGNSMAVLEKLGNCARSLRYFNYSGFLLEDGAFEHIARGAPLGYVRIVFRQNLDEIPGSDARMEDIVRTFSICPNLRRLQVEDKRSGCCRALRSIADICCRIRLVKGNRVSVNVLNRDYLVKDISTTVCRPT